MRIHYYKFPEGINAQTRFLNGAVCICGICDVSGNSSQGCSFHDGNGGCPDCSHYKAEEAEDVVSGITVSSAKKLLRLFGGIAWTDHIDRSGGVFETTDISLEGNNSHFKYNHHL